MKCKVRFMENFYLCSGKRKLKIYFDEDMYCFNSDIIHDINAVVHDVVLDHDFPLREESKINHILALYYHQGDLSMIEPVFDNMYTVLKGHHIFGRM